MQQGEDGVEYAGHLLTIARALGGRTHAPAAPSMALRSTLARRVAVVLDHNTPHAPATRASLALTWTVMVCVTCGIAACDGKRAPASENIRTSPLPAEATAPADSAQLPTASAPPAPQTPESAPELQTEPRTAQQQPALHAKPAKRCRKSPLQRSGRPGWLPRTSSNWSSLRWLTSLWPSLTRLHAPSRDSTTYSAMRGWWSAPEETIRPRRPRTTQRSSMH